MAKNEAKIKFTAETSEFNDSIKKSNRELSELRSELKLNDAQMQNAGVSIDGLKKKHDLLEEQLSASREKTEALSQKVEVAARIFGENSEEASRLRNQLANAQIAEEKVKKAISDCNAEIDRQEQAQRDAAAEAEAFAREQKEAERPVNKLTGTIEEQQTELAQLKKKYADAVLEFGEGSDEAEDLGRQIDDLSDKLAENKRALKKAEDAADKFDNSLDDVSDAARDTEDGFTVMKGAVADLVSEAIQWGISKVGEFIDYLMELPEATREIRQDMATLETSFKKQGFSTETATQTWRELYNVFGEDDRAVEAANLISKMSNNQEDLNSWVTITKGIWGEYQDSLPVEGLAEASNETAKTGKVTGVLADALNWSGEAASMFSEYMSEDVTTAEDAFNEALAECTTEQERQALITETLTALYGDSAKEYEKASGAQTEAKDATAENILIQNEMADAIEPVTTAWQGMKNELASNFLPVIEAVAGFFAEHPSLLKLVAVAMVTLGVTLGVVAVAWGIYTVAQWAANTAILGCPLTWIVVAIAAVVAAISLLVVYWDEITAAVKTAAQAIWNAIKTAWDWIVNLFSSVGNWIYTNVIQPVVNFFMGLWDTLKNVWNGIVNVVKVAIMFIGSIISAAWNIITLPFRFIWENCKQYVFAAFEWIKEKISNAVQAIKNIFSAIKNFFAGVWSGVKNVFAPVASWFREKFQAAKNGVQNAWSSVKGFFSNIWSGVKSTFSNVGSWFREKFQTAKNGVKNAWSTVTSFFSNIKNKIVNGFANIKEKLSAPFKAAIDKIKGFFNNLKLKFPNIKMPHFKVTGKFSLDPPSVPKLSVEWYAKGAIFKKPTIFNTPFGMKGVGEAGAEAVLPIDKLQGYIAGAIEKSSQVVNLQSLADAIEDIANRPIQMNINGKQFALATASDTDNVNGTRSRYVGRGLILD